MLITFWREELVQFFIQRLPAVHLRLALLRHRTVTTLTTVAAGFGPWSGSLVTVWGSISEPSLKFVLRSDTCDGCDGSIWDKGLRPAN